jgi:signal transduction histidine kinase
MRRAAAHPLSDLLIPLALGALGLVLGAAHWPLLGLVVIVAGALAWLRFGGLVRARWTEGSRLQTRAAREAGELSNDLAETMEMQRATSEVLKVIGGAAFDLDAVFRTVSENAMSVCDADCAQVFVYDDGAEVFRLVSVIGASHEYTDLLERNPIPPGRGTLVGKVALERKTVQIADALNDPEYEWKEAQRLSGFRTIIGVPMLEDGDVLAVISAWRTEVRPFSKRPIELLRTLADEGAIAIRNARLVRTLEDKSQQLEVASRHKSEFLANMSHELRTPLNAVIGFSDVLLEAMFGPINEKQREYLNDIRASGHHLLELLNDILDLSKVEAGQMDLRMSEFSLLEAIDHGLMTVRTRANNHKIVISVDAEEGVDRIEGDELRIKQVLWNLLSNAVKFTPDGGRVTVVARQVDDEAEVLVRDNGIGIPPEDHARIFDSFQQGGRRGPSPHIEGTGLGLTLSKRILELHGGRIWLESEVGVGSTFGFALPLRQPAVDQAETTSPA